MAADASIAEAAESMGIPGAIAMPGGNATAMLPAIMGNPAMKGGIGPMGDRRDMGPQAPGIIPGADMPQGIAGGVAEGGTIPGARAKGHMGIPHTIP